MDAFMIKNLVITKILEEEPELFITYNGLTTDIYIDNIADIMINDSTINCLTPRDSEEIIVKDVSDVNYFVESVLPSLI